jgi:hypothetical protein
VHDSAALGLPYCRKQCIRREGDTGTNMMLIK